MFIKPMLAAPLPEGFGISFSPQGEWIAEEKFDGHRLIVRVSEGQTDLLTDGRRVQAWSRDGLPRILPSHITEVLAKFPVGVYDGELLVPGKRSYGVTALENSASLVFMVFDLLSMLTESTTDVAWKFRRQLLETTFQEMERIGLDCSSNQSPVRLATVYQLRNTEDIAKLTEEVWRRDGEGLILKRTAALYYPGKRSKDFLKVKALRTAVLQVTGFQAGKLGPCAIVILQDEEGHCTTVKARNTQERQRLEANPQAFIGRLLRIEYQERTPDGSYRHGRWDRFENE